MSPCELAAPTVVSVLLEGLGRNAWHPVPAGDLDGLVGAGLDAIALLARVVTFAVVPALDRLGVDIAAGRS